MVCVAFMLSYLGITLRTNLVRVSRAFYCMAYSSTFSVIGTATCPLVLLMAHHPLELTYKPTLRFAALQPQRRTNKNRPQPPTHPTPRVRAIGVAAVPAAEIWALLNLTADRRCGWLPSMLGGCGWLDWSVPFSWAPTLTPPLCADLPNTGILVKKRKHQLYHFRACGQQ